MKYGLYEYLVMPFGRSNAPAYFQRFVDEIFQDMIGKFVVIYLDDFLIYSQDEASHHEHVMAVLERLRENHLFAKLEKCQFSVPSVKFLGFNVSAEGFTCDESKIQSITNWPVPKCKKDVQVFLGLTNYLRKFVDGFSNIAIPLQRLTRKRVAFDWLEGMPNCIYDIENSIIYDSHSDTHRFDKTILGRNRCVQFRHCSRPLPEGRERETSGHVHIIHAV